MMLACTSGCRGAFAKEKDKKEIDPRCASRTSALLTSPDGATKAWRSGTHTVCWINGRGQDLSIQGTTADPTPDARGELRFTSDGRALEWHALVPDEAGYDGSVRPKFFATISIDVKTGERRIVPDEPGADQRWGGLSAPTSCSSSPSDDSKIGRSHDGRSKVWQGRDADGTMHLCFERDGARRVLLSDRPASANAGVETGLSGFADFVFSRDDRVVFFTSDAWVVSTAAHAVEIATGKEWFVVDGQIVEELDYGPYKGNLLGEHFRLDDQHPIDSPAFKGRGVVMTVVDWHGKKLKRLPDDEKERAKVLRGSSK